MRAGGGPYLPMRRVEDLMVPTPGGGEVPVRVYLPSLSPPVRLPVVLWVHGGGWVVGSVASYDQCCRRIAAWGNVCVVSVEYRRSPEHRYPCGLDDVAAAYAYTVTTLAQEYNTVRIHTHRDRTAAPWCNREGLIEVYYVVLCIGGGWGAVCGGGG